MRKISYLMLAAFLAVSCKTDEPVPSGMTIAMALEGDTLKIALGDTFALAFMIGGASDVYAVAARLSYDTTFVRAVLGGGMVSSRKGAFLGATGDLTVGLADRKQGLLVAAYSKQGDQPGSGGEGALWETDFLAMRAGISKLLFDKAGSKVLSPEMTEAGLKELPAMFVDSEIAIREADGAAVVYLKIVER